MSPRSMNPNMTGLNHTGFGASSPFPLVCSLRLLTSFDSAMRPSYVITMSGMARRRSRRRPLRVTTVIGETLILAGLGVFGYIVWQPWHTGVTVQNEQRALSSALSELWDEETSSEEPAEESDPEF